MNNSIILSTEQEQKDYLIGSIIRLSDNIGKIDEALEFIKKYRTIDELKDYKSNLKWI